MGEPSRNFSDIMKIRSPDFSLSSAKDIPFIPGHHRVGDVIPTADSRLVLQTINRRGCTITKKAPTRAFSWLKVATSAFTFKALSTIKTPC